MVVLYAIKILEEKVIVLKWPTCFEYLQDNIDPLCTLIQNGFYKESIRNVEYRFIIVTIKPSKQCRLFSYEELVIPSFTFYFIKPFTNT